MKKTVFILLAFMTLLQVNAQNEDSEMIFAPIGAKWYYKIQIGPHTPEWYYRTFEAFKDTIIEEKKCVILKQTEYYGEERAYIAGYEYLCVEEQKVYHWNKWDKEFDLLYDFSANVGDSWEIPCLDCDGTGMGNPTITIDVEEVDYINYSGLKLKSLRLKNAYYACSFGITATERLGGNGHLFLYPYSIGHMFVPLFYCYSDNETTEPCDVPLGISSAKEQTALIVTHDYVQLPASLQLKTDNARFYSIDGKVVLSEKIDNNQRISIANLSSGIFILSIETKNEGIKTFKIGKP